jgi:Domain of unknown function (DUF4129)
VLVSWQHTVDGLRRTGLEISPSETPHEVASRVGPMLEGGATVDTTITTTALEELADEATAAAYSGQLDGGDPDRCEDLRSRLQHGAVKRLPFSRRLVWRFLPVSLRA